MKKLIYFLTVVFLSIVSVKAQQSPTSSNKVVDAIIQKKDMTQNSLVKHLEFKKYFIDPQQIFTGARHIREEEAYSL